MKFNWGHGITLVYILFAAALGTALVASFGVDHSLVRDDYYALDLSYQERLDRTKNAKEDNAILVKKEKTKGVLNLKFKDECRPIGHAILYRPSDKSKDIKLDIDSNPFAMHVPAGELGKWRLEVEWTCNDKGYYYEELVFF